MERKLSVLMLSPHPRMHGGVCAYAETLKAHLPGFDVHSFWVGRQLEGEENPLSVLWRLLVAPFQVLFHAWRLRPDVIHLNPSLDAKALLRDGLIFAVLAGCGFRNQLVFFHGWDESLRLRIATNPVLKFIFVGLLKRAACLAVLAPQFKAGLVDMGLDEKRIIVSRTMVDKKLFGPPAEGEGKIILFLSRFDRRKGCHELLEAFAALAPVFPDWKLVFAGDGPEMQNLHERAVAFGLNGRVTFPGYVAGEVKNRLLRECAIFALPTSYPEGMPIALLEAMAAGKPLLTTQVGGIASLCRPECGVLVSDTSMGSIEQGLRRLMEDESLRHNAGASNAVLIAQTYDAPLVAAEMEDIYRGIAHA